jgi:hypothetical protein
MVLVAATQRVYKECSCTLYIERAYVQYPPPFALA